MPKRYFLPIFISLLVLIIAPAHAQSATRIRDIQGLGHESALLNTTVYDVTGIVTAIINTGFWMQDPNTSDDVNGDADSEGIFVFTNTFPSVSIGDAVSVSGVVRERYGQTQIGGENAGELPDGMFPIGGVSTPNTDRTTITDWDCGEFCIITPIVVGNGDATALAACDSTLTRQRPLTVIDDDALTSYDPDTDGMDFWESLEGMMVCMHEAITISPNRSFNEFWIVPDNGDSATPLNSRGGLTITAEDFNPETIHIDDTLFNGIDTQPVKDDYPVSVDVGMAIEGAVTGIIGYGFGNYEFLVNVPFTLTDSPLTREVTDLVATADNQFTIATYNVENLMGNADEADFISRATQICENLLAPDVVMLQEIQDNNGDIDTNTVEADKTLTLLIEAIDNVCGAPYTYAQIDPLKNADGGQPGGNIRVAFLYRTDRPVRLYDSTTGESDEAMTLTCYEGAIIPSVSLGRIDPTNIAFNNGFVDGVEYFSSRKPLVGYFLLNGVPFYLINLHLNSKGGDDPLWGFNQPPVEITAIQRRAQVAVIKQFVQDMLDCRPDVANVIIAGDYNDFQFSDAVTDLISTNPPLTVMNTTLPAEERYSYNYQGNAQALDHISVSVNIFENYTPLYDTVHINSEFADQVSDHDPSLILITIP
ncbi:MAG: nuclease [bacterium]|nr:nuclease [bacterium]